MLKVKVKGECLKKQNEDTSEDERISNDLGFENVSFEDVINEDFSAFWKLNLDGYKGSKFNKTGFLVGPTLLKKDDDEIEYSSDTYEIFAPKVSLLEKYGSPVKKNYRMLIYQHERLTYFLFLEEDKYKLSMDTYVKLDKRLREKAINIEKKLDPLVEFNDENPLEQEDYVKFMYYNESNLAIKLTPKFSKKIMTSELCHLLNVIKCKFSDNPLLTQYQITSTSHWLLGVRSLPRILIIILPAKLSQGEAEDEATAIINNYFPNL